MERKGILFLAWNKSRILPPFPWKWTIGAGDFWENEPGSSVDRSPGVRESLQSFLWRGSFLYKKQKVQDEPLLSTTTISTALCDNKSNRSVFNQPGSPNLKNMVEYRATEMLRDVYKLTKTFVYYLQAEFTHREAIYEERKIKAERERINLPFRL